MSALEMPGENTTLERFTRFVDLIREARPTFVRPRGLDSPLAIAMQAELDGMARSFIRRTSICVELDSVPKVLQEAALGGASFDVLLEEAEIILRRETYEARS